ncbi:hypothetical protein [Streptomyces violascens]|uniref:hypothetical protein n=1 Tax=Streptomyces violascens TaxID=67381 RepID=UPI0036A1CCAA
MPDPVTGEGFDAPTPADAYRTAPPLTTELVVLLELLHTDPAADPAQHRLQLLRQAAAWDRASLERPGDPDTHTTAVRAARELARYDRQHPALVAGPHGPDSIEFDPGPEFRIALIGAVAAATGVGTDHALTSVLRRPICLRTAQLDGALTWTCTGCGHAVRITEWDATLVRELNHAPNSDSGHCNHEMGAAL